MAEVPKRYDIATDVMLPVTQEWVDSVEVFFQKFGNAREAAKHALTFDPQMTLPESRALRDFLAAWQPEFEQKR